jgi:exopolyphosphatase/guanosine-5'-triphosphate,3'-diphosphate pyrophosphatase
MILAAIDIGSNAARLLITEVIESDPKAIFEKLNLVRVPLRLGFDVFEKNEISEGKISMLIKKSGLSNTLWKLTGLQLQSSRHFSVRDAKNSPRYWKRSKYHGNPYRNHKW